MLAVLLGLAISLSPKAASYVAGWAIGVDPAVLLRICRRESLCRPIGAHRGDAGAGPTHYAIAISGGALHPEICPMHRGDPRRFSTRGSWGTVAAYVLQRLPSPLDCWAPPEVLDVPLVGGFVAALHARDGRHPATRRWSGL